jgi:hypothetical protein
MCSTFQIRARTWIVLSRRCASWTSRGTRCADVGTRVPWNSPLCAGPMGRRTRMSAAWDKRPADPGRTSGLSTGENAAQVRPVHRLFLVELVLERIVWDKVTFSVNAWQDIYRVIHLILYFSILLHSYSQYMHVQSPSQVQLYLYMYIRSYF